MNEGGINSFFDLLTAVAQVSGEGGPGPVCFHGDGIDMIVQSSALSF